MFALRNLSFRRNKAKLNPKGSMGIQKTAEIIPRLLFAKFVNLMGTGKLHLALKECGRKSFCASSAIITMISKFFFVFHVENC